MRHQIKGELAEWTFYEVTAHGFTGEHADRPLYGFAVGQVETPDGKPKLGELYASLEHAMVAAVGEKFTGPRGAGGTGVGTAADWFMRMIGAHQLRDAGRAGSDALAAALVSNGATADTWTVRRIKNTLEGHGVVLAHVSSQPYSRD